jgi:hypothetical protein
MPLQLRCCASSTLKVRFKGNCRPAFNALDASHPPPDTFSLLGVGERKLLTFSSQLISKSVQRVDVRSDSYF